MIVIARMVGRFLKTWFFPSPAHDAWMAANSNIQDAPPSVKAHESADPADRAEYNSALPDATSVEDAANDEVTDDATGREGSRVSRGRPPSESRAVDSSDFADLVKEPEASDERMSRVRRFDDETGAE